MTKTWQVWLVLVLIFVTGGVSGGLVGYHIGRKHQPHWEPPEVWGQRHFDYVAERLGLTPEQKAHLRPIVMQNIEELVKLRRQAMQSSHDILLRMEKEVAAQLTPEQKAKYEEFLKERRAARRQGFDRGPHGERGREPGPPPPPNEGKSPPPPPPPGAKATGT